MSFTNLQDELTAKLATFVALQDRHDDIKHLYGLTGELDTEEYRLHMKEMDDEIKESLEEARAIERKMRLERVEFLAQTKKRREARYKLQSARCRIRAEYEDRLRGQGII